MRDFALFVPFAASMSPLDAVLFMADAIAEFGGHR